MKLYALILTILFIANKSVAIADESIKKPSLILVPAFSYLLPGLDSFIAEDYSKGFKLLGYGATGLGLLLSSQEKIDNFVKSDSSHFHHYRDLQRERQIGQAMLGHSMMLSLYDSFSTRAEKAKANGEYLFLPENQNIDSILKAPFKFEYLKRWTTIIPFSIAVLVGYNKFNNNPRPEK